MRTTGYVLGGAGVAGLAAAGLLGILTLRRVSESDEYCHYPGETCSQQGTDLRDEARTYQTAGFVVAGVSAAALVAGVTLVLSNDEQAPTATVSLGPTAIRGGLQW